MITDVPCPSWFSDDHVMISTAPTCGLSKGGRSLGRIDQESGRRLQVLDEETQEYVDDIDDQLLSDMLALKKGGSSETVNFISRDNFSMDLAVPTYYDHRYKVAFEKGLQTLAYSNFTSSSLEALFDADILQTRGGHGSPSSEERVGEIPYIKVSDLRAGLVNINPTNRVPRSIAQKFWKGKVSGLRPFDLICPERTSKNIGDFCVLMPGQEQVVLTKEMIILRPGKRAYFDQFYLLWALTLTIVRNQWKRIIFMQTNREDVGRRFHEIEIPMAPDARTAYAVSDAFRTYYLQLANARMALSTYLNAQDNHHFFVSGAEELTDLESL